MSDLESTTGTTEQTVATPEATSTENEPNTTTAKSEEVSQKAPGIFSRMFAKMTGKEDSVVDDVNPKKIEDSEDTIEIDEQLYEAGKAQGWDDDKILKYYQEDKSVLEALVSKPAEKVDPKPADTTVDNKPVGLEKLDITDDAIAQLKDQYGEEVINQVVKPLLTKLNQTIEIVNAHESSAKQVADTLGKQAIEKQITTFQSEMDKLGKTYDIFGQWENVPRRADGSIDKNEPVVKVRSEVWDLAVKFQKLGNNWDTAVSDAVSLYKGRNLETLTKTQLIKELNKRKIKFTPRPTSKKVEPAPLTGDAHKIAVIKKGLKAIGKE